MKVGFVGAGKVGFSLGKYFKEQGIPVSGYVSRHPAVAREAAEFTGTGYYETLEELVRDSDVIFLTVSDDAIGVVWEQVRTVAITGKYICHCSGVLSSEIFSDITDLGGFGYSIHPLMAVNDRLHSYHELSSAIFTIEGEKEHRRNMEELLRRCGNEVLFLESGQKIRYHGAAVMASNLVLGLAETAMEQLMACGFSREQSRKALSGLMYENVKHFYDSDEIQALTGPVERGDCETLRRHMEVFSGEDLEIYRLLSRKVQHIAGRKNPERDYKRMEDLLG